MKEEYQWHNKKIRLTKKNQDVLPFRIYREAKIPLCPHFFFRRFGHQHREVSELGDINLVGFNDLAVEAPYDGPGEKGAIYFFHAPSKGIGTKASQVNNTEELGTFGFALAGAKYVDGNRTIWPAPTTHGPRRLPLITLNNLEVSRKTLSPNR